MKVFICYRREDSKHASGRLHLALVREHMPEHDIFFDIRSIKGGVDFPERIESDISKTDVLIALIGANWVEGRRLDDPSNQVRREILAAQKYSVPILPVLLDEAKMPAATALPEELRFLCNISAERLTHEQFQQDAARVYLAAWGRADTKTHSGPLPPLLQEQMEQELEDARTARRRRDLSKFPSSVRLLVEHAQHAEIKATMSKFRARGAAESAKAAALRARHREAGYEESVRTIKGGGGEARWAGEGPWDHRNGFGEYSAPINGGGRHFYGGKWKDNCESGFGVTVQTDADGGTWRAECEMAGGKRHGFGVQILKSGDAYAGEFQDDHWEGPGVYRWKSGGWFEGEWRAGKKGAGVHWFSDGSSKIVDSGG